MPTLFPDQKVLVANHQDNSLDRRLALYLRPDLLILDDFGLKLPAPSALEHFSELSLNVTTKAAPCSPPTVPLTSGLTGLVTPCSPRLVWTVWFITPTN